MNTYSWPFGPFALTRRALAVASACAGWTSTQAWSQVPVEPQATLPAVTVSATRTQQPVAELPVSTTVINREEIVNSPIRTMDDALRDVAGVQLPADSTVNKFPLNPSIAMRGLGVGDTATRSLVLVDGLPINGGFFGNIYWNRAPSGVIERVEVVRGSSSNLFGSYAMGGVVNIVTRPVVRTEGEAEVQYGTENTLQGNVGYGGVISDRTALGINANFYSSDGYYQTPASQRTPVDQRAGGDFYNVQARADLGFSQTAQGFIKLGQNTQRQNGNTRLETQDTDISDAAGGVDFDLGSRSVLGLRAFYARENFHIDNVNVPDPSTSFVSNRHHTTSDDLGFSALWSQRYTGFLARVNVGTDFRYIDGQNDQDIFNTPGVLASTVTGKGTQTSVGVFGELTLKPTQRTELLAGLRYDNFKNSDGAIITDGAPQTFADREFDFWSPRLAGRYQVDDAVAVRAAYYQGFRAPTLSNLYRSFETPTFRGLSNPNLKEERLKGGDVGLDFRAGALTSQVNYFYNILKDFVGSAEVGFVTGKFTVQNENVAQIRSRGLEFVGDLRFTKEMGVTVNFAYTDSVVTRGPYEGNKTEGTPEQAISVSLYQRSPSGLSWNLRWRYVGDTFQDITNTSEGFQDAHSLLDALVTYRVKKNLDLFVSGTNLLDEEYISDGFGQTLGAPRQISAGARLRF